MIASLIPPEKEIPKGILPFEQKQFHSPARSPLKRPPHGRMSKNSGGIEERDTIRLMTNGERNFRAPKNHSVTTPLAQDADQFFKIPPR
jgi:hypothetical protein